MTNKTPRIAKNRRESTSPGTRKTGKLFFFLRGATALLVAALQLAGRATSTVRYCSSFQLTHMSREDHAQSSIDMSSQQWRPKVRQELITVLTTSPAR